MQKEHGDLSKVVWFRCDRCGFKCRQRRTIAKHKQDHKTGVLEQKRKMVFKFVNTEEAAQSGMITKFFMEMTYVEKRSRSNQFDFTIILAIQLLSSRYQM